jgi:hypothetical protein
MSGWMRRVKSDNRLEDLEEEDHNEDGNAKRPTNESKKVNEDFEEVTLTEEKKSGYLTPSKWLNWGNKEVFFWRYSQSI